MPVGDLVSNWAYMVMASAGVEPEGVECPGAARARPVGGEVPGGEAVAAADGVQHVLRGDDPGAVPDRAGRPGRIVYRLLSWNPWQGVFLRLVERLHGCRLC